MASSARRRDAGGYTRNCEMRSITEDVFDVMSLGDGWMEDGGRLGRSGRSGTDGTTLNTTDEAPGSSSNS